MRKYFLHILTGKCRRHINRTKPGKEDEKAEEKVKKKLLLFHKN